MECGRFPDTLTSFSNFAVLHKIESVVILLHVFVDILSIFICVLLIGVSLNLFLKSKSNKISRVISLVCVACALLFLGVYVIYMILD